MEDEILKNARLELEELKQISSYFKLDNFALYMKIKRTELLIQCGNIKNIDQELRKLEKNIRKEIFKTNISEKYKSPNKKEIWKKSTKFEYERALYPTLLEKKIKDSILFSPQILVVFHSCMSAIDAILKVILALFTKKDKIYIISLAYYFETISLFKIFYNIKGIKLDILDKILDFYNLLENNSVADVFFVEGMDVNLKEDSLDVKYINSIIRKRKSNKPVIIIIDTTLINSNFNVHEIFYKLNINLIIFVVRSGLKLEQQGLELANIGIVEIYTNDSKLPLEKIKNILITARTLCGTSISQTEEKMLLSDLFFCSKTLDYISKIEKNAERIYTAIRDTKRKELNLVCYKEHAPFLLLYLIESNLESCINFISRLRKYLNSRKTDVNIGTSFGFRHLRIEIIKHVSYNCIIRISPGVYWGNDCKYLVDFLNLCE